MSFTTRPVIMGTHAVITTGHYLATFAGLRVLQEGGNAIDAGVTAGLCLAVLEPQLNGIGGEVPILVCSARTGKVQSISGQGTAPRRATIEWFREQGIELIPGDGFLPATVPGAFDAWVNALREFGTMPLSRVLMPAIELAESGFPMYTKLRDTLLEQEKKFTEKYPTSGAAFLSNGIPEIGEIYRQPQWAATFRKVLEAEKSGGLDAAHDYFYKGEIAERIAAFSQNTEIMDGTGCAHSGLLDYDDLANYHGKIEDPPTVNYRGIDVFKCGPWSQGPVFLQQLTLLEGFDLAKMGHNSVNHIHNAIEAAKLAFADREAYYGDPDFDDVPMAVLMAKEYADRRRRLIGPDASTAFRPGDIRPLPFDISTAKVGDADSTGDTTHLDVIDAAGNMFSATPSGGWCMSSPVIEGLGFPLGTRGQMFFLDPRRPNHLEPGKRPRTTLTPSLATKDGKPYMALGTPGGDMQDQWTLQFFLNVVDFGMNIQEALDAPTYHTSHFPSSFYPRTMYPNRMVVEGRIPKRVQNQLIKRGHEVVVNGPWAHGRVLGIQIRDGVIFGGSSPRMETGYAAGW